MMLLFLCSVIFISLPPDLYSAPNPVCSAPGLRSALAPVCSAPGPRNALDCSALVSPLPLNKPLPQL